MLLLLFVREILIYFLRAPQQGRFVGIHLTNAAIIWDYCPCSSVEPREESRKQTLQQQVTILFLSICYHYKFPSFALLYNRTSCWHGNMNQTISMSNCRVMKALNNDEGPM